MSDANREAIAEQVRVVLQHGDGENWPDDPPRVDGDGAALGAWSYVTGYANALGLTARELLDHFDIPVRWPE